MIVDVTRVYSRNKNDDYGLIEYVTDSLMFVFTGYISLTPKRHFRRGACSVKGKSIPSPRTDTNHVEAWGG